MGRPQPPRIPHELRRVTRAALLASLAFYLVATAYLAWRLPVLQPYSDMFDWLNHYFAYQGGMPLSDYLWTAHNFHRLVPTFGLIALDIQFFGANNYLLVGVGVVCIAVTAAVLAREAAAAAPPPLALPTGVIAAMAALTGGVVLDAVIPINGSYVHALMFAVLAMVLAEPEYAGGGLTSRRGLALICAAIAPTGNAAALAVWPVLVFAAMRGGRRGPWLPVTVVAMIAYVTVYVGGQTGAGARTPDEWAPGDYQDAIHLALSYLGLPWTRAVPGLGWLLGLGLLLLGAAAVLFKGGAQAPRGERLATQLVLFSLVIAAMAALGRTGSEAPWNVPLRYVAFLVPLHVGLVMLAAPYAHRLWQARPRLTEAVIVAGAVLLVGQHLGSGLLLVRTTDVHRQANANFRAGLRQPEMLMWIHPDLEFAAQMEGRLAQRGLYRRELHLKEPPSSPRSREAPETAPDD